MKEDKESIGKRALRRLGEYINYLESLERGYPKSVVKESHGHYQIKIVHTKEEEIEFLQD